MIQRAKNIKNFFYIYSDALLFCCFFFAMILWHSKVLCVRLCELKLNINYSYVHEHNCNMVDINETRTKTITIR